MSKKENQGLRLIIGTIMVIASAFAYAATEIKVLSWLAVCVSILLFLLMLWLTFHRGYHVGLGKLAREKDLDTDIVYGINQIVRLKNGLTFLFLEGSVNHQTEIVMEPRDGFYTFEILDDKYLVSKKRRARVVNGSLWTPVS